MTVRLPTEARRQAIVEAALRLLGDRSLDALTTRDIAAELGVTQPGLFNHFATREELVLAVVAHARAGLAERLAEGLAPEADPVRRLAALGLALLAHVEANPGLPRLLFLSSSSPGPVRDALAELVLAQAGTVAALVREGQAEGAFAEEVDAAAAAAVLVGTVQGLVLRWEAEGRPPGLPLRFPPCFAVWLRGVRAEGGRALPAGRAWAAWVDAAPLLAARTDPLDAVLAAARTVRPGGVLLVRAPFRPAPLVALLGSLGHAVADEPLGEAGWLLVVGIGRAVRVEDLRELPAPEPLERVLHLTAEAAPGPRFVRLPRFPALLVPHLRERGAAHTVVELPDGSALLALEPP